MLALPEVGCSQLKFQASCCLPLAFVGTCTQGFQWVWWYTPVISALKKAEATGLSQGQHSLPHKFQASQHKTPSVGINKTNLKTVSLHRDQLV